MGKLAQVMPVNANKLKIAVAEKAMIDLTNENPILTGRSRYSWRASTPTKENGNYPHVKGVAFPWRQILTSNLVAINSARPGDPIHIVNNAPYIILLERGYSPQAARMWIKNILTKAKLTGVGITLRKRLFISGA